jgi:hypothetical protein
VDRRVAVADVSFPRQLFLSTLFVASGLKRFKPYMREPSNNLLWMKAFIYLLSFRVTFVSDTFSILDSTTKLVIPSNAASSWSSPTLYESSSPETSPKHIPALFYSKFQ